jgi:hypothetical protein
VFLEVTVGAEDASETLDRATPGIAGGAKVGVGETLTMGVSPTILSPSLTFDGGAARG